MGKLENVLKDINHHFGFLYDKGFKIRTNDFQSASSGDWIIVLESKDCLIEICYDRSEILVDFVPYYKRDEWNHIGLKAMIYFLSQGNNFIPLYEGNMAWGKKRQLEIMAGLLAEYLDQITPYLGEDFHQHRDDLFIARSKYIELSYKRFLERTRKKK